MAANDYHFITHWLVEGSIQEVVEILADATDLPRWWPSVYLDVQELAPGDEQGIGKVISLYTRGWLPYTLRWQFRVAEVGSEGFSIESSGDFDGRGVWTFAQRGPVVDIVYDWRIRADKLLLRRLSGLMKPIFAANHRWAMVQGETSLKLEMARRRAAKAEEHVRIPPPPRAPRSGLLLLGALVIMLGLCIGSRSIVCASVSSMLRDCCRRSTMSGNFSGPSCRIRSCQMGSGKPVATGARSINAAGVAACLTNWTSRRSRSRRTGFRTVGIFLSSA